MTSQAKPAAPATNTAAATTIAGSALITPAPEHADEIDEVWVYSGSVLIDAPRSVMAGVLMLY